MFIPLFQEGLAIIIINIMVFNLFEIQMCLIYKIYIFNFLEYVYPLYMFAKINYNKNEYKLDD